MRKTKSALSKPTHKQMLILFWFLVGMMLLSWIIVFTNGIHGLLNESEPFLGQIVFVMNLSFLPVIFLIPLIGGGYFHKKEIMT